MTLRRSLTYCALAVAAAISPLAVSAGASGIEHDTEPDYQTQSSRAGVAEGLTSLPAPGDSFAWQNEVAIAATDLESKFPNSYAGAEIVSTSPATVAVRFKGPIPAQAYSAFEGLTGVEVTLEGNEAHSQMEVSQLVAEMHTIASRADYISSLSTEYDRSTDSIIVTVGVPAVLNEPTSRVTEAIYNELRSADVGKFSVRTGVGVNEGDSRNGGGRLEVTGSSGLACTSGFNVVNSSGVTGIATAGHCSNLLTHENISGQTEYGTTYKAGYVGTYGDFQWSITGDTEPDDFYYNSGSVRDVSGVASPLVNQYLCRYGQTTGAQCAEVENNNICYTISAGTACNLTRMKNDEAEGGDSGGPWYYGNTAYGFHSGQVATILGTRDVFSKATLIDEALGVVVRTT